MSYPQQVILSEPIDLKLAIKSSLSKNKSLLSLVFISWYLNKDQEYVIVSENHPEKDKAEITDSLFDSLVSYFRDELNSTDTSEEAFRVLVQNNPLFQSQIESLIVSLELIWRFCKVNFTEDKPFSAERQGGGRYSKRLSLTKNVDSIELLYSMNEEEFRKIFYRWITEVDIEHDIELENKLVKAFTLLSEEAIFEIQLNEDQKILFRNLGIYSEISDVNDNVSLEGEKEKKGPLRILHSLLKENLNYYLKKERNSAKLETPRNTIIDLQMYANRVSNYLDLININISQQQSGPMENLESTENATLDTFQHNLIVYGAPGTGKSYEIESRRSIFGSNYKRVTFHPNTTYGQFIGAYKPTPIYKIHEESSRYSHLPYVNEDVDAIETEETLKEMYPIVNEPYITYEFVPGVLLEILVDALKNEDEQYLLIIEEINRANVAAVFGDFFQLLDRDKKGKSEYKISISKEMKAYLKFQLGIDMEELYLPSNLYIWATMNTADQGVLPLDSAFKRRWEFEYVGINQGESEIVDIHVEIAFIQNEVRWNDFRKKLNEKLVNIGVREDKLVGPFFIKKEVLSNSERFNISFKNKLLMYLFNDVIKQKERLFIPEIKTLSQLFDQYDQGNQIFNFEFDFNGIDNDLVIPALEGSDSESDTEM